GHALTLALVGGLVVDRFSGDVSRAIGLPTPFAGEGTDERLMTVLDFYDQQLTEVESTVLIILSVFRTPIDASWFSKVFRSEHALPLTAPLVELTEEQLVTILGRLGDLSILRANEDRSLYDLHPLLRQHYQAVLETKEAGGRQRLHARIAQQYLAHS